MKMMKKVKIDSRSFYLSQYIYILQGSHTVEKPEHDIDDASMRCQSGTYKVKVVRQSGTYSVSKGVLGRMGPMYIQLLLSNIPYMQQKENLSQQNKYILEESLSRI